jgi:hypothetical protein
MKRYWGMFHYMVESAKDRYRQFADATLKGPQASLSGSQGPPLFQYGDWFDKYPHGVSRAHWEDPDTNMKKEKGDDAVMGQRPDLQSVEEFFASLSPSAKPAQPRKLQKRDDRRDSPSRTSMLPPQPAEFGQQPRAPQQLMDLSGTTAPTVMAAGPSFPRYADLTLYQPPPEHSFDRSPYNYNIPFDHIPQLDRNFVYGAYTGADPSTLVSGGMPVSSIGADGQQVVNGVSSNIWTDPFTPAGSGEYFQPSAWFLPFNLDPLSAGMTGDPTGQMQNPGMPPDLTSPGGMMNTFDLGFVMGNQPGPPS